MIRLITHLIFHILIVLLLTVLTQIGGIVYLIGLAISKTAKLSTLKSIGVITGLYLITAIIIVPLIAPIFGRTALPLSGNLRPLNLATCLFNRHYVRPVLKQEIQAAADKMDQQFPGTKTNYLDANFPFYNGFPLIPHLSHNDGRKLDIAFYYEDIETQEDVDDAPSWIGYGIYDGPKPNEVNYPRKCAAQGKWQYGAVTWLAPKWFEEEYIVDAIRTKALVQHLAQQKETHKIFIEPHLKTRWGLGGYDNIRFTGCHAVRHDDHIHLQIR